MPRWVRLPLGFSLRSLSLMASLLEQLAHGNAEPLGDWGNRRSPGVDETGRREQAAIIYGRLSDDEALAAVRADLGAEALRLGGLPEFEGRSLDGRMIDTAAMREGKVTVLDFWATWCKPCLEELPTLRKIQAKYGNDVALIGVNMDSADTLEPDELRKWISDQGVPGTHLFDGEGWQSELVRAFGVAEIPFNVVIGPSGEVLAVNMYGKDLRKSVNDAVQRIHSMRAGAAD